VNECIDSALQLTYPNKEVIVVDDGSTDKSPDLIAKYGEKIIFRRTANAGANATRNLLTSLARGEWLQYLDADDYLLPGKIVDQIAVLREKSGEADVIYSPMIMFYSDDPVKNHTEAITSDDPILNFIRWTPFGSHSTLFRRESILAVGGWKPDQPCCQEHELILRLLMSGARFVLSQTPGAVYRKHGSTTISTGDPMRVIRMRRYLTDQLVQFAESSNKLRPEHRAALFVSRMESARSAFKFDPSEAEMLSAAAFEIGARWKDRSPALPAGYRLSVHLMGFGRTERLAAWIRRPSSPLHRKSADESPSSAIPGGTSA
jgi:glycosyltransferase involved in cell wall biosynthesis